MLGLVLIYGIFIVRVKNFYHIDDHGTCLFLSFIDGTCFLKSDRFHSLRRLLALVFVIQVTAITVRLVCDPITVSTVRILTFCCVADVRSRSSRDARRGADRNSRPGTQSDVSAQEVHHRFGAHRRRLWYFVLHHFFSSPSFASSASSSASSSSPFSSIDQVI
jgi:hypothetical protein